MGSGGGTAQLCEYNAEVILIPVTKLGIYKTSSRVGREKTRAGCTQAFGDLSLGRNTRGHDPETIRVPRGVVGKTPLPQGLRCKGSRQQPSVFKLWTQELGVRAARQYPGLLPSAGCREWVALWHLDVVLTTEMDLDSTKDGNHCFLWRWYKHMLGKR